MIYEIIKRVFDVFVSLICIIATLPIWIIIAIGIKLSSKGPIFYATQRVGKNRKLFTMYKFRTMHVYQPINSTLNKTSEGGYIANLQRIFRFGSFLRKSKLDELPQFINVFMSQMSVVGPRPITKAGVEKLYNGRFENITSIKPGLACLDSLYDYAHGELFISDNEEYIEKVLPIKLELARLYVEKRSITLDMKIIARTVYLIFTVAIRGRKDFTYTEYEQLSYNKVLNSM